MSKDSESPYIPLGDQITTRFNEGFPTFDLPDCYFKAPHFILPRQAGKSTFIREYLSAVERDIRDDEQFFFNNKADWLHSSYAMRVSHEQGATRIERLPYEQLIHFDGANNMSNRPLDQEIEKLCTDLICEDAPRYKLYSNPERTLFHAGCRDFTRDEALMHWAQRFSNHHKSTSEHRRAQKFLEAIKANPVRDIKTQDNDEAGTQKQTVDSVKASIQEAEKALEAQKETLAKLEEQEKNRAKPFRPELNENYYYVKSFYKNGKVFIGRHHFTDDDIDHRHQLLGNCFRTRDEAIAHGERLVALHEVNEIIREENGDWVVDWEDGEDKGVVCYHRGKKELHRGWHSTLDTPSELELCDPDKFDAIKSRITQDQINKIWRL